MKNCSSGFFLGICVVLAAVAGCKEKLGDQLPPAVHDTRLSGLLDEAERFKIQASDSLYLIGSAIWEIGKDNRDTTVALRGKLYMARSKWTSGSHSEAMRLAMEVMKEATDYGREELMPEVCAVIGNLHKEKANYPLALETIAKGRLAAEQQHDTAGILYMQRLQAMFTRGWGIKQKNDSLVDEGLRLHMEGLRLAEASPAYEMERIGYYNNIGQDLVARGRLDEAAVYLNKALLLAEKYNSQGSLSYTYNWMGNIESRRGRRREGLLLLEKALKSAQLLNRRYREMELYSVISNLQREMGLYKEAIGTFERYTSLRDSLKILENVRQLSELQVKYESDRKDEQIAALDSINQLKTRQANYAVAGFLVFFILSIIMIFQYRIIRRSNRKLEASNALVQQQAGNLKVLMKELHHRVKNNLQIVSSLLSLQSSRLTDDETRQTLRAGQQRIEAMSLIHKSLYNNEAVNLVDMREYVPNLVESIVSSFGVNPRVFDLTLEVRIEKMDVDQALPIGLIINECVTNTFKHAFDQVSKPSLTLTLELDQGYHLRIADNGNGMDLNKWTQPGSSFGIKLVKVLSRQLDGTCTMEVKNGTRFDLTFPELKTTNAA